MKTISFALEIGLLVALLVLASCGRDIRNSDPYGTPLLGCEGSSCFKVCQHWADQQPLGTTRYAGAYYCKNNEIQALLDRQGSVQTLSPGTYSGSTTGLACTFTVAANCVLTEQ